MHDLRNRLGLLDVTPSKTEKRVHVYGIVSRETRDSTNINFTIARRRGAIVDLHVDTVHVYSICACEIADFAPKNSSDLHLSRGPPRRRRGVLEPPQPPPPGYAPGVRTTGTTGTLKLWQRSASTLWVAFWSIQLLEQESPVQILVDPDLEQPNPTNQKRPSLFFSSSYFVETGFENSSCPLRIIHVCCR